MSEPTPPTPGPLPPLLRKAALPPIPPKLASRVNPPSPEVFPKMLAARAREWRRGRLLALLLGTAGIAAALLVALGTLDAWLALSTQARTTVVAVLAFGGCWLVARGLRRISREGPIDAAQRADAISGKTGMLVRTAHELSVAPVGETPLHAALRRRAIEQGVRTLRWLPHQADWPGRLFALTFGGALLGIILLFVCAHLAGPATPVLMARWFTPWRDVPPLSPWHFAIKPEAPRVPYGESVYVSAEITGAPVDGPVWLLVRGTDGASHGTMRQTCFEEGPTQFGQRIDEVTGPLEFAFATGRGRSAWHAVEVLYQPKVLGAVARVTPPAYTGIAAREFAVGASGIEVPAGSTIDLTLRSNRPLRSGTLKLTPNPAASSAPMEANPGVEKTVAGMVADEKAMHFTWTAYADARVSCTLDDVRGTQSAEPFTLPLKVRPDQPAVVAWEQPQAFSLATPDAVLDLKGTATDDYGLSRIDVVRTVSGYRDRARHLELSPAVPKQQDISGSLDLSRLGARAGDVLELYLEARDNNPDGSGLGRSPVVQVQVISREDYAQLIRLRTSVAEFEARHRILREQLDAAREAYEALARAASDPSATEAERQAALDKATAATDAAHETFRQMAHDFAAYDSERDLLSPVDSLSKALAENQVDLRHLQASTPDLAARAQALKDRLSPADEAVAQQAQRGEQLAKVAHAMELATELGQLIRQQRDVVRELDRLRPHIYTPAQVRLILRRARSLTTHYGPLHPLTYETFIGLMACTGIRSGEARRLKLADFDPRAARLHIAPFKASPERTIPLHPTTVGALSAYAALRRRCFPFTDSLLIGVTGRPLATSPTEAVFNRLVAGIASNGDFPRPRMNDFRHTFASHWIAEWSMRAKPVSHYLLLLARYLGHKNFASTWWYVTSDPRSLRAAADTFRRFHQHGPSLT